MKLIDILKEISLGGAGSYSITKKRSDPTETEYSFETEAGNKYFISFKIVGLQNDPWAAITVDFGVYNELPNYQTGEGKFLKILNTVVEAVKKHINTFPFEKYQGIKYLVFTGTDKIGASQGTETQRGKIYKKVVQDTFPNLEVGERYLEIPYDSGTYLVVNLDDINELNESRNQKITLYHGTSSENAKKLLKYGWKPNQLSRGSSQGNPRYLYLTSHPDDAMWFAQQKGESSVLKVKDIPLNYLIPDPEDEAGFTMDDLLNRIETMKIPSKFALVKSLGNDHFEVFNN